MSYLQYFGLKHDPLGKNHRQSIPLPQSTQLTQQLTWLLQTKGIGLIAGEAGTGKTTALREWANGLNPLTHQVIYQSDNHFKVFDIYSQLGDSLGLERYQRYSLLWRALKQALLDLVDNKQRSPIWIVDEAHLAPANFFTELPAFLNFSFDSRDIMTIILVGLPSLPTQLKKPLYSPLNSRIHFYFEWQTMDNSAVFEDFMTEAFKQAGGHQTLMTSSGLQFLHMISKGKLRIVHQILVAAMQYAMEQKVNHLSDDIIQHAVKTLQ